MHKKHLLFQIVLKIVLKITSMLFIFFYKYDISMGRKSVTASLRGERIYEQRNQ